MAIINCPECSREVSDKASACPNCGFGVAKYIERQDKIAQIQSESEKEAYLYVLRIKEEEKLRKEQEEKRERDKKNNTYQQAIDKYESSCSKDVEQAEKMFLSISGWQEADAYYEKCKRRIEEVKQQEKIKADKDKKRNKKIKIIAICILLVVIILGIFYKIIIVPEKNYEKGMAALESGHYDKAVFFLKESNIEESEIVTVGIDAIMEGDVDKADAMFNCIGEDAYMLDEVQNAYFEKTKECIEKSNLENIHLYIAKIEHDELNDELCDMLIENGINAIMEGDVDKADAMFNCIGENAYMLDEVQNAYFEKACESIDNRDLDETYLYLEYLKQDELKNTFYELCYPVALQFWKEEKYDNAHRLFSTLRFGASGYDVATYLTVIDIMKNGELSLKQLREFGDWNIGNLPEEVIEIIDEASNSINSIQGCYKGGRPYYFYINELFMYWGDETGCSNINAIYDYSSKTWIDNYGEDIIGLNADGLETTIRTYERITVGELPDTFSLYIQ